MKNLIFKGGSQNNQYIGGIPKLALYIFSTWHSPFNGHVFLLIQLYFFNVQLLFRIFLLWLVMSFLRSD